MSWKEYYAKKGLAPSDGVLRAMAYFKSNPAANKTAIDLGCGNGRDTLTLLKENWKVYAIDAAQEAIDLINTTTPLELKKNLELECKTFAQTNWRSVDLINASLSLPFCKNEEFSNVLKKINHSILPNGLFTGNFFGEKDDWKELNLLKKEALLKSFEEFEILFIEEMEFDKESTTGPIKHWHVIEIMAKKTG